MTRDFTDHTYFFIFLRSLKRVYKVLTGPELNVDSFFMWYYALTQLEPKTGLPFVNYAIDLVCYVVKDVTLT